MRWGSSHNRGRSQTHDTCSISHLKLSLPSVGANADYSAPLCHIAALNCVGPHGFQSAPVGVNRTATTLRSREATVVRWGSSCNRGRSQTQDSCSIYPLQAQPPERRRGRKLQRAAVPHRRSQLRRTPWFQSVSRAAATSVGASSVALPRRLEYVARQVVGAEREASGAGHEKQPSLGRPSPALTGRCLTLRSRRGPTAGHQARSGGTRYIFTSPGLASCRRSRLTSNVRQHNQGLAVLQQKVRLSA